MGQWDPVHYWINKEWAIGKIMHDECINKGTTMLDVDDTWMVKRTMVRVLENVGRVCTCSEGLGLSNYQAQRMEHITSQPKMYDLFILHTLPDAIQLIKASSKF